MSYRIDPKLELTAEVRRIAAEEIDQAIRHLEAARNEPDEALHKCRKRLKNVRGLLRLVRLGDEAFFQAENARFRDVAKSLAARRDAAALIETVDRLASAFPKETDEGGLQGIRSRLVVRRDAALNNGGALGVALDAAIAACRFGGRRIEALVLPDRPHEAADVLAEGAGRTMRQARKALRKAREGGAAEDFHELRKAVKTHAMHLALLKRLWPSPARQRRKALHALGEGLGELNDVLVLGALVDGEERPLGKGKETRLLSRLLRRSEKRLRKECLRQAEHLFGEGLSGVARKLARKAGTRLAGSVGMSDTVAGTAT